MGPGLPWEAVEAMRPKFPTRLPVPPEHTLDFPLRSWRDAEVFLQRAAQDPATLGWTAVLHGHRSQEVVDRWMEVWALQIFRQHARVLKDVSGDVESSRVLKKISYILFCASMESPDRWKMVGRLLETKGFSGESETPEAKKALENWRASIEGLHPGPTERDPSSIRMIVGWQFKKLEWPIFRVSLKSPSRALESIGNAKNQNEGYRNRRQAGLSWRRAWEHARGLEKRMMSPAGHPTDRRDRL